MNKDVIDKHYRRLASDYDQFLYYSPEFVRTLTAKMIDKLKLQPDDVLADIGCGTGMYSADILKQAPLRAPVIGVDPYAEMLAQIPEGTSIQPVAEMAEAFAAKPDEYNKVLIKETVHHVQEKRKFFEDLYRNLPSGGVLLLVHVPPAVKYPLFQAALERCLKWHADPAVLTQLLRQTGFTVEADSLDYRHVIPRDHYFNMVRKCYMSVLTSFSADELDAGLDEMRQRYGHLDELEFIDHFDYLTATK